MDDCYSLLIQYCAWLCNITKQTVSDRELFY